MNYLRSIKRETIKWIENYEYLQSIIGRFGIKVQRLYSRRVFPIVGQTFHSRFDSRWSPTLLRLRVLAIQARGRPGHRGSLMFLFTSRLVVTVGNANQRGIKLARNFHVCRTFRMIAMPIPYRR